MIQKSFFSVLIAFPVPTYIYKPRTKPTTMKRNAQWQSWAVAELHAPHDCTHVLTPCQMCLSSSRWRRPMLSLWRQPPSWPVPQEHVRKRSSYGKCAQPVWFQRRCCVTDRSLLSGASCVTQLGWGQQAIHHSISHGQEWFSTACIVIVYFTKSENLVTIGVNYSRKHHS